MLFPRKEHTDRQPDEAVTNTEPPVEETGDSGCDPLNGVQDALRLQQDRLKMLSGSTEDEFLSIGARLLDFHTRSTEIRDSSAAVTEKIGGEEIQLNIHELEAIIDRMGEFLNLIEGEAEQSSRTLRETLQMIAGVDEPLAGFKKIMKVLNVLGISTKIESARLGRLGAGFNNLADDVKNLAVQINEKSARIMGENVALSDKIRETLSRMSEIESGQRENVRQVLVKTRTSLEMITGVHEKCAEVAAVIASASGEVSRNISEVVTSMQSHDIVRQQMEHVQQALCDMEQRLAAGHGAADGGLRSAEDGSVVAGELFNVCRLQSAQLQNACDGLTTAVFGIVGNLQGLVDKGRGVAWQTREMIRVADGAGDSLFVEIEKSLAPVVGLLAKSAAANRNLTEAVGSVAETVNDISRFVIDIETIGEEIKLIAMNSQIKAALTGKEGAALGVLAEAIQRLSVDACYQTTAVTGTLREITRVTEALSGETTFEAQNGERDIEAMSGRLKGLVESIRAINEEVMTTLARSDAAVQELSNDIESATGGIMVHEFVAAEVADINAGLEQIMSRARTLAPEAAATDLSELSSRYTMQSERQIHASYTGAGAAALVATAEMPGWTAEPAAASEGEEESDFGDNIELF